MDYGDWKSLKPQCSTCVISVSDKRVNNYGKSHFGGFSLVSADLTEVEQLFGNFGKGRDEEAEMGGEFWELDVSTPRTLEGLARPVPGDPIPLGLSRGCSLSRAKQLHFMQRFMTAPFVPSYAAASDGLALHRVLTIPFSENWFATLLGQFNLQKFWTSLMNESGETPPPLSSESSWRQQLQRVGRHLRNKSLYALGFSSELLLTPDDTLLLGLDSHSYSHGNKKTPRKKAVLHHKVFVLCCVTFPIYVLCSSSKEKDSAL